MLPSVRPTLRLTGVLILALASVLTPRQAGITGASADVPSAGNASLPANAVDHPLRFEPNEGQTDDRVEFLSRGKGYTLFVTPDEAVLSLYRPATEADPSAQDVVRLQLLGANPDPRVKGADPLAGRSHYLIGNDPARWRTDVPHYGGVRLDEVYPGVDLVYYGTTQRRLEFDFVVAPGADPDAIRFRFAGADSLRLDDRGDLVLYTPGGRVVQHAPIAYQTINGTRHEVDSRYALTPQPPGVWHLC